MNEVLRTSAPDTRKSALDFTRLFGAKRAQEIHEFLDQLWSDEAVQA